MMDVDTLAQELHAAFAKHVRERADEPMEACPFEELPPRIQDDYRAVARRAIELLGPEAKEAK